MRSAGQARRYDAPGNVSKIEDIAMNSILPTLLFLLFAWGLPVLSVIWFVRYLIRADRERRLLRVEISKLVDAVRDLKQPK